MKNLQVAVFITKIIAIGVMDSSLLFAESLSSDRSFYHAGEISSYSFGAKQDRYRPHLVFGTISKADNSAYTGKIPKSDLWLATKDDLFAPGSLVVSIPESWFKPLKDF